MFYVYLWAALVVGFLIGYVLCALLRANNVPESPSFEVTAISPQQMQRMGEALSHAGDMLESGDFEYVSGGLIVQDLGHGVVTIRGDVSLRAREVPKPEKPKTERSFIGQKRNDD